MADGAGEPISFGAHPERRCWQIENRTQLERLFAGDGLVQDVFQRNGLGAHFIAAAP